MRTRLFYRLTKFLKEKRQQPTIAANQTTEKDEQEKEGKNSAVYAALLYIV
jgi:hypothetical protein